MEPRLPSDHLLIACREINLRPPTLIVEVILLWQTQSVTKKQVQLATSLGHI